ncbi:transcription-repair-coupling factor [Abditibacteriota bacterium]|nr:transcription-repair-coupling factor [Abditibacteriota bacterium]
MHLLDLLDSYPPLQKITFKAQAKQLKNAVRIENAPPTSWAPLVALLARKTEKCVILVCPTSESGENALLDLTTLREEGNEPLYFPAPDRALLDDDNDRNATQDRLAVLDALHRETPLVVTTATALAHPTLPVKDLVQGYDELKTGQKLERDDFVLHLAEAGYERMEEVEGPGQFALRGGIVDFYPPAGGEPVRLELWGDEIDSLRSFDLDSQRSTGKLQSIRLTPPRELYLSVTKGKEIAEQVKEALAERLHQLRAFPEDARQLKEKTELEIAKLEGGVYFRGLERYRGLLYPQHPTLFDHLPTGALIVFADPDRSASQTARLLEENAAFHADDVLPLPPSLCDWKELRSRAIKWTQLELRASGDESADFDLDAHTPPAFAGNLPQLGTYLRDTQFKGDIMVCATSHARRVREIMADQKVSKVALIDELPRAEGGQVLVFPHRLTGGFRWGATSVMCDVEMFGWQTFQPRVSTRNRKKKKNAGTKFSTESSPLARFSDLQVGDYIVHINHGIARYGGVVQREIGGAINEYLALEYEGQDRLYVPVAQLDRVQKYLGSEAAVPSLTPLKGGVWEKAKQKAKEEAIKAAQELAVLYAAREKAHKKPVAPDSMWQREMESSFPFEETPSQLQAIKDAKVDMEKSRPMDRLVCGDVGFGKTEVAVRAAFKAVQDGRQVAILVPTTVLAQQHFQTFSERMSAYPVRIEVVSRFKTATEIKRVLEAVKNGAVDIVVGTHRLIQPDVEFHDLGLVVVDEEQRFGVLQKERLKELRAEVDILTMSATPIPRTLQLALGGLRGISLITDPPQGRLPVRTYVMQIKDGVLKAAVERELEREGQVYYVHNRIETIGLIAEKIQKLVPNARIGVGHGQMGDEELEQVFLDFINHRTDVLLATTIIENGIDLANANTIICDNADRLGLSQMYQLRGRVGRSPRQAYAYFFHGSRGKLPKDAEDRFAALQENTDLGAGFRIAMRDLEIRGAGDVLGLKQSGTIAAVGMELYSQFLAEAVAKSRGERVRQARTEELPEADLPLPALLPDTYVKDDAERLRLYRAMTGARNLDDVTAIQEELRDRFGPLPPPAFNLIRTLKIRINLLRARLRSITKSPDEVLLRLQPGDSFAPEDLKAVEAAIREKDKRSEQHISLRKLEGLAIKTRTLGAPQLLRLVEIIVEALADEREKRLSG